MVSLSMVFTLNGTTFTVSKASDYRLMGYSGLEAPDYEIDVADNGVSDGGFYQSSRVAPRPISISFMVIDAAKTASGRTAIMSFFKPKLLGSLAVTRGSTTRNIGFYLASKPEFINPDASVPKLRVTVNLICPNPYFEDSSATVVNAASHSATIDNVGDVPCGFICTITATGGAVIDPVIEWGGSGIVTWAGTLANTDVEIISTVPGNKYITIKGVVSYTYAIDSAFNTLAVGPQTIVDSATTGGAYIVASYSFSPLYLGV